MGDLGLATLVSLVRFGRSKKLNAILADLERVSNSFVSKRTDFYCSKFKNVLTVYLHLYYSISIDKFKNSIIPSPTAKSKIPYPKSNPNFNLFSVLTTEEFIYGSVT